MDNLFEKASRMKLRFDYNGRLTVEDLWDVPLTALDKMYKYVYKQLQENSEVSLLETKNELDIHLFVTSELIKHIVQVRLNEKKKAEELQERREKKQKLLEIIADKQDESLKNMSVEDLTKMVEEL
jgi:hypothetical protein